MTSYSAPEEVRRRWIVPAATGTLLAVAAISTVMLGVGRAPADPVGAAAIAGLERMDVSGDGDHTSDFVSYPHDPPAGGPHNPVWQNCGFYDEPIRNEHAVHSLEHGAVWITYRPDLTPAEVEVLRSMASRPYVLVSPYPNLPAPVVLSAWGFQLKVDRIDINRIAQFVTIFAGGPQAPERGGPCQGGIGRPNS